MKSSRLLPVSDYIDPSTIDSLIDAIAQLQQSLESFNGHYVPPEGTIAHRYWVKGTYAYNKLMAPTAIFPAVETDKRERTGVVHLSKDEDERNIEARKGITRMQRLTAIREQLRVAQAAMEEAIALAQAEVEPYFPEWEWEWVEEEEAEQPGEGQAEQEG